MCVWKRGREGERLHVCEEPSIWDAGEAGEHSKDAQTKLDLFVFTRGAPNLNGGGGLVEFLNSSRCARLRCWVSCSHGLKPPSLLVGSDWLRESWFLEFAGQGKAAQSHVTHFKLSVMSFICWE